MSMPSSGPFQRALHDVKPLICMLLAAVAMTGCSKTPEDTAPPPSADTPPVNSDWAEFLGTDRNMTSPETHLLREWPSSGPPVVWETAVNRGFAGPAVADGEVFLMSRGDGGDVLRVLSLDTGEELWTCEFDTPGRVNYDGARSTPTVTDDTVFVTGILGLVAAVSRETHEPIWSLNLMETYDNQPPQFGYAPSPLVIGDKVIVTPVDRDSPGMVALSVATGEEVWKSEPFGGESYASPKLVTLGGVEGIIHTVLRCSDRYGPAHRVDRRAGRRGLPNDSYRDRTWWPS